ncbi:translocation/assembly module TamB domain-containing protein [Albibacillus kandeliae]|uniref:translocation/assembly module TamB domain-containing protein n=1 Tax=Albibacillus kandeliae TaxID=2174228 RepID=UPI000D68AA11|nr:translocation/assembly module TamB domain-containing protein [Albibacillus kandeliae]
MRYLTLALALLFTLTITQSQPLLAQDSTDDDGGGSFISNLLEKSLSGDNRNVRVVGLSGALSSSATIQQIIISDDEGPWLTISNAQLDWARAALLRGNLRINKLSAETIELSRAPGTTTTEEDLPSPEATPFQIPELPVAVNIGELSVGTLTLGEPVIGVAASLTINGKLVLEDGSLDTTMAVTRLDRPGDEIDLTAGFSNATRQLTLDLSVTEDAGGLVSELMKIPDRPSVRLTAKGEGPVTDFTADLSLATDGTERVTGQVSLAGDGAGGDIDFAAQMDGDLTPLLAEPYREFFGTSSQLRLDGSNGTESGLEISEFSLAASALDLSGSAKIGPDGTLQNVALDGSISPPEGETVTLPTGDPVTEITSATIKGGFDAAEGNSWQLTADIRGMSRVDISFDRVELTAEGTLEQGANTHLAGNLTAGLTGLTFPEEQLREAIGETLDLDGSFDWNNGALTLDGFELTGTDYAARLSVLIDGLDTGFNIGGTAEVEATDLSRFSAIAGQSLGGSAKVALEGNGAPLNGTFDVRLNADAQGLRAGIEMVDPLIGGETTIRMDAARDGSGTMLRSFELQGEALSASASGTVRTGRADLTLRAALDDLGRIVPASPGPVTISGDLSHQEGTVTGTVQLNAPNETFLTADGTMTPDGALTATYRAAFNQLEDFVAQIAGNVTARGDATRSAAGIWEVTSLTGGTAGISGRIRAGYDEKAGTADLDFDAGLARLERLVPQLTGAVNARGKASRTHEGQWNASLETGGSAGIEGSFEGDFNEASGEAHLALDAAFERLERFVPQLAGTVEAKGRAERSADQRWSANITTGGSAGITGRFNGAFTEPTGEVDVFFDAALERLQRLVPQVSGTLEAKGRARRDDVGKWLVNAVSRGDAGLSGTFKAEFDEALTDAEVYFDTTVERIERFVQDFAGTVTAAGVANKEGDVWSLNAKGTGPGSISADVNGTYDQAANTADITAVGQAQLGLANAFISPNSVRGLGEFNLALRGAPSLEALSGTVSASGVTIALPSAAQTITGLNATARLSGGQAQIGVTGGLRAGGQFRVDGSAGMAAPYNGNITTRLVNLIITDNLSYTTTANGQITMNGPLTGGATIAGQIDFGDSEININTAGGSVSAAPIPEIGHMWEPGSARQTRARAGLIETGNGGGGTSRPYNLNVVLNAPNKIFVRGRGLNAELGGRLVVGGNTNQIVPSGQIGLIRGTFSLLGRRLELDEGQVSMQGNLEPYLYFVATTSTSEGDATLTISGPTSAPVIEVTSTPERPSEEALALLLFGDQFNDLSPLKIAQLASQVATLSGKGGGLLGKIRRGLGVDNLDLGTDDDGNAQVGVGAYLSDDLYTDVSVNADGQSEVNLNFDLTDNLTIKGSVDNAGETGIGLFFKRDY